MTKKNGIFVRMNELLQPAGKVNCDDGHAFYLRPIRDREKFRGQKNRVLCPEEPFGKQGECMHI